MAQDFGPYKLLSHIAQGAACEVFLAQTPSRQRVAVKRLLPHRVAHTAVEHFEAEAARTARCRHENIARLFDTGQVDGVPYMALEYIDGLDLFQMTAHHPLARTRALAMVLPIAHALGAVHNAGLVHSDVTPHNIVVPNAGTPKLIDFGVAVEVGTRNRGGTSAYMSPEHVTGERLSERADVFSLAVVTWELFSRRRLFGGREPQLTLTAVVRESVPPIGDSALDRVLGSALAKNPSARTPNCSVFAQQMEELGNHWDDS